MGLSSSALDMERLSELVSETLGLFARTFPAAFQQAVLDSVKEESMLLCRKGWELSSAPLPAHYLKRGYLTKQGHSVKSWKRRLFTALNAADNFVIVYFVDEHVLQERGRIECFGCRVEAFSDEEVASFGPFGFKVVPYLDTNRSWLITADSEEDKIAWQAVFANACRKASPRVHEDPVVAKAFLLALERSRKAYSLYGRAELVGTEVESLCNFVIQILLRELLDDAFSAIKSTAQRNSYMKSVKGIVEGIVRDAAVMTWRKCVDDAISIQGRLRSMVSNQMPVVLDSEERLNALLKVEIEPIIRPVMNDVLSDTVLPFISVIYEHVVGVHSAAAAGFWEAMRSWIMRFKSTLATDEWNWTPLEKHLPASALVARRSSRPSSGVTFDARQDDTWSRQYHQYGVKEKEASLKAPGGSPGFGNTAYMRNKSFTGADAQPLGAPLRKAASMCYDVDSDTTTPVKAKLVRTLSESPEDASMGNLMKRIINELFRCHVGVDDLNDGLLRNCVHMLWNLYTSDLATINGGVLSDTLSAYDVYSYWLDSLQVLLHNAIYTFELMAKSLSDEGITPSMMLDLVNDVTTKLITDAQKSLVEGLNALAHDLVRCTCQEIVEAPCLELGPSFAAKIPAVIRDAVSIENLIEATVEEQVKGTLSHVISCYVSEQKQGIESPF